MKEAIGSDRKIAIVRGYPKSMKKYSEAQFKKQFKSIMKKQSRENL